MINNATFFHHTPKHDKKEAPAFNRGFQEKRGSTKIATKIIGTEELEPSLRTQAIALPTELRSNSAS